MGLLSPHYNASFDGVSFWEQDQAGWYPGRNEATSGTAYSKGGGAHTYVNMGAAADAFSITAGLDGAEYTSILAKRGTSGTLVWSRGSLSATLLDIVPTPGKAGPLDAYTVTLRLFSSTLPSMVGGPTDGILSDEGDELLTDEGDYLTQG